MSGAFVDSGHLGLVRRHEVNSRALTFAGGEDDVPDVGADLHEARGGVDALDESQVLEDLRPEGGVRSVAAGHDEVVERYGPSVVELVLQQHENGLKSYPGNRLVSAEGHILFGVHVKPTS